MSEGIIVKRVLLLLPFLIVQYPLSGADEEMSASPSVSISTDANTPSKQRVKLSSNVLQLMRQNSQEVQKDKKERKEKKEVFAERIAEFDVIFGKVVKNKQSQDMPADDDLFFRMDD